MGDITKINGAEIEPVWVVTGGSPCQDLSIAGKRAGLAGARSGLFMEQVRIVKEMREADKRNGRTGDMVRPRYLVWENVVGAFSSNKGKDFAAVLEEIARIAEPGFSLSGLPDKQKWTKAGAIDGDGWSIAWRTHDAKDWGKTIRDSRTGNVIRLGTPQRRRRISVVADFGGESAAQIQFDRESVSGHPAESGAAGERLAEAAESCFNPAVGDCLTAWDCQSKRIFDTNGKSPTLQGGVGGGVNNPAIFAAIPINDKATRWQGGGESRNHDGSGNGLGIGKEGDPSPTLTAGDRHGVMCMTPWDAQSQRVYDGNGVSPTLSSRENSGLNREAVLCAGFKAGQGAQAGGIGYSEEVSPTLAAAPSGTNQTPAVVGLDMTHACDVIRECGEQVPALQARMGTGGNQVPLTYQMNGFGDYRAAEVASSCKQRDFKDSTDLAITHMVVRRLTPMECERLQGFPDHWTDIGEWMDEKGKKHKDADSPRYKALGNSIALPFWDWMLRRMARYLPEDATLGSLFDGIAGFPLIWERIHGKGTARWASEIEPFPIAVTKKHFPEEE
ncbi:MAG: DNA cytosine methyltransferase [Clostridiales bacterium]|nr:DNA cytosine methyltransferase [Clostridiales bacterium]